MGVKLSLADVEALDLLSAIAFKQEFEQISSVDDEGLALSGMLLVDVGIQIICLKACTRITVRAV